MPSHDLHAVAATLNHIAGDSSLDPAERIKRLREAAQGITDTDLLGQVDSYIGSLELRREAAAMSPTVQRLALRENANIREALLARGEATPEEMDAAGILSHDELDAAEQDGSLSESFGEFGSVREVLEEGLLRKIMRLPDGKFAPKGMGQELTARGAAPHAHPAVSREKVAGSYRYSVNLNHPDWENAAHGVRKAMGPKDTMQLDHPALDKQQVGIEHGATFGNKVGPSGAAHEIESVKSLSLPTNLPPKGSSVSFNGGPEHSLEPPKERPFPEQPKHNFGEFSPTPGDSALRHTPTIHASELPAGGTLKAGKVGEASTYFHKAEDGQWWKRKEAGINDGSSKWEKSSEPNVTGKSVNLSKDAGGWEADLNQQKRHDARSPGDISQKVDDIQTDLEKTSKDAQAAKSPGVGRTVKTEDGRSFTTAPDGSVDVKGDVTAAAELLGKGEHVRLEQPHQVTTLLNELATRVNEAKKLGENAPNYNLCNVTVPGTNLFCVESKGIPRIKMPQLSGIPKPGSKADKLPKNDKGEADLTSAVLDYLKEQGVTMKSETVPAAHLRATQNELNGGKVAGIAGAMRAGKIPEATLLTSSDDYIVDGHHRFAAKVGNDAEDGHLGDETIPIQRIDMPIIQLLAHSTAFATEMGIPTAGVGQLNPANAK